MDLVAGDRSAILVAISTDDLAAFEDATRFAGHLSLGPGLDPTWLDLYSEAARAVTGTDQPMDFLDARVELDGPEDTVGGRTIERVDRRWVEAIARLSDHELLSVAGHWLDLLEEELGELPREEKPWIRELAGRILGFCRDAERAPDVFFVWSL
jgi:hypothetical protein